MISRFFNLHGDYSNSYSYSGNSPGAEFLRTMFKFTKRKKNSSWLVYVFHKMEIRHFQAVVVWWRQKMCKWAWCTSRVVVALLTYSLPLSLIGSWGPYFYYHCHYWYPLPVTSCITSTSTNNTTRYPYSLPLTLPPNHYHLRRFWVKPDGRQMLLLGAHMIDYHGKYPL